MYKRQTLGCIWTGDNVGKNITSEKIELNHKVRNIYWLIGRQSRLSLVNKLLIYKAVLKPVWTYGIQLWGTASTSNIEIIQRFQSKTLRSIVDAPWFVSNNSIHRDLKVPTVREEIMRLWRTHISNLEKHPNHLAINLLDNSEDIYRLKRHKLLDLSLIHI